MDVRIDEVGGTQRGGGLVERLVQVWERSVRATHLFLTEEAIADIKRYVPEALCGVERLAVAAAQPGAGGIYDSEPVAFMGVEGHKLEMLFVDPAVRGQGVGRALLTWGIGRYGVDELGVNEQNPQARGFYEHLGFKVYRRTETDEQGNPYPILYMRRSGAARVG